MLPIIKLSQAWLEELGWSHAEAADVFDMDLAAADPAGVENKCPQCGRHPAEYRVAVFVPDPATATPEKVSGRAYVMCLCGRKYWYAAVHEVDAQPVGSAEVRAARTATEIQPSAGSLQIEAPKPAVTENVPVTDVTNVVIQPEPPPPGGSVSSDSAAYYRAVYDRWYRRNPAIFFQSNWDVAKPDAGSEPASDSGSSP